MNFIGRFRSNYFAVKDRAAFDAWCQSRQLKIIVDEVNPHLVGFLGSEHESGLPWIIEEEVNGEEKEITIDFIGEIGTFLADNSVAIVIEITYEGYRYLGGVSYAINNKGERKNVTLASIVSLAQELGDNVTKCEY